MNSNHEADSIRHAEFLGRVVSLTVLALVLLGAVFSGGCHSRIHTTRHYEGREDGLVHRDRTRAYSLFGKSESTQLRGSYDYAQTTAGRTNVAHSVSFGVEGEKRAVDAEGIKATGEAGGNAIGAAGSSLLGN